MPLAPVPHDPASLPEWRSFRNPREQTLLAHPEHAREEPLFRSREVAWFFHLRPNVLPISSVTMMATDNQSTDRYSH